MRLLCIFLTVITASRGLNLVSRKFCCGLGTKHASSDTKCNNYPVPITGIRPQDESSCLHSLEVCCTNQKQTQECESGVQEAKNGNICSGDGFTKDCCDACQLGLEAGTSQKSCTDGIGLGVPLDKAFTDCCNEALTSTTTTSTTTVPPPITNDVKPTEYSPLPHLENVCDIGDVCAQICIPIGDSYKCACNKGFTLMADGISCKPEKRALKKGDRCSINNPCDHDCIDTGVAIKCSCRDGYKLADDKRTCIDLDECALGTHDCQPNEECVNDEGSFFCEEPAFGTESVVTQCPTGYKFNYEKLVCDDINECEFDIICPRPKICFNTIGSFECKGDDVPQCPPGFHFKDSIQTCTDIDECITGENDCNKESQTCLNTKGNYTCVDKVSSCPPGFKKNPYTQNCEDINECLENKDACPPDQKCINEPAGHNCVPKDERKVPGFPLPAPTEPSLPPMPTDLTKTSPPTTTTTTSTTTTTTSTTTSTTPKPRESCIPGLRYNDKKRLCEDINECEEENHTCDSNQECYNSYGSYVCLCKSGFKLDNQLRACVDINECQVGTHDCTNAYRCDNTLGSYVCARTTGCGTGYTLNLASNLCEDDDECLLGTHTCGSLGPNFKCRNKLGSYRCDPVRPKDVRPPVIAIPRPSVFPTSLIPTIMTTRFSTPAYPVITDTRKQCLPGYHMDERGVCQDINECLSNPCSRGQSCINFNGRHQCISNVQCKIGYELDENKESCIDINECTRGTHKCSETQICKNGRGFYTCECPPGHHMNLRTSQCEDIDECKIYRACGSNAECVNTVGSYKCYCKEGFKDKNNGCQDIDECKENPGLCQHNCINLWGSYRCACNLGFILNYDNRTCTDIDECDKFKDKKLCIGTCENIPGSYKCTCPNGYTLGADGRTCQDVNECKQNICSRPDDVCLNTRGGYKCYTIHCPQNYIIDPQHKGRCKRPQHLCDPRDLQCIRMPEQFTYHYITFVSDFPILNDNVQLFQMNGPRWANMRSEFTMNVIKVHNPTRTQPANDRYFKMVKFPPNMMQLYLVRTVTGPQEIELKVQMDLYQDDVLTNSVVSYIFIVVSEYPF